MIDITGLREDKRPQSSTIVHALLDRLEAAESECLEQARLNGMGGEREAALMAKLEAAERERDECNRRRLEAADHFAAQAALMKKKYDALRAKIAEMERQEPVAEIGQQYTLLFAGSGPITGLVKRHGLKIGDKLYALPGAQPAPSFADAYQGAMEEVAIWKKRALEAEELNRKFIAEINGPTHMGEPAQPTPSIPEGWKLVPIEPTHEMLDAGEDTFVPTYTGTPASAPIDVYRAMLAAAPEAKP